MQTSCTPPFAGTSSNKGEKVQASTPRVRIVCNLSTMSNRCAAYPGIGKIFRERNARGIYLWQLAWRLF
ncbi:hypothetical protein D3C76_1610560 [compost metagenome]